MAEIVAFLEALPEPVLYLLAGVVVEAVLQLIKRWWQPSPAYYGKLKLIGAAALVSLALTAVTGPAGVGRFAAAWLMSFLAAVGWHETKDKLRSPIGDLLWALSAVDERKGLP